jgi:hypothetical protein
MRMQRRVIFGSTSGGSASDDQYLNHGSPQEMAMREWEERDDLIWPHELRALVERYRRVMRPQTRMGGRKWRAAGKSGGGLGKGGGGRGEVGSARRLAMVALKLETEVFP